MSRSGMRALHYIKRSLVTPKLTWKRIRTKSKNKTLLSPKVYQVEKMRKKMCGSTSSQAPSTRRPSQKMVLFSSWTWELKQTEWENRACLLAWTHQGPMKNHKTNSAHRPVSEPPLATSCRPIMISWNLSTLISRVFARSLRYLSRQSRERLVGWRRDRVMLTISLLLTSKPSTGELPLYTDEKASSTVVSHEGNSFHI